MKRIIIVLLFLPVIYVLSNIIFFALELKSIPKRDLYNKEVYLKEDIPIVFYKLNQDNDKIAYITSNNLLYIKNLARNTFLLREKEVNNIDLDKVRYNPLIADKYNNYYLFGNDHSLTFIDGDGNLTDVLFMGNIMDRNDFVNLENKYNFISDSKNLTELNYLSIRYFLYVNNNQRYYLKVLDNTAVTLKPENINKISNPAINLELRKNLYYRIFPSFCEGECEYSFYAKYNNKVYRIPKPWDHDVPLVEDILLYDGTIIWPNKGNILRIN